MWGRGDLPIFRRALVALGFLPELLSASVRCAQAVHDVEGMGALLPRLHVADAGLELPLAPCLRDFASHAPRVQRHGEGSALAAQLAHATWHAARHARGVHAARASEG